MKRSPNPMDPLDDVKRWFAELWPVQQCALIVGVLAALAVLVAWALRGP